MSRKVKGFIEAEIGRRLAGISAVGVMSPRGIDATANNQIRGRMHKKGMRMTVVRNNLAKRAAANTPLKGFEALLDGPSAIVYGKDISVSEIARLLLEEKKTNEKLELRGVFFEGDVYAGTKGVEAASKLPTRQEALANLLAAVLSPGRKLAAALVSPGKKLASVIKTIEEKAEKAAAPAEAPASA